jgi:hypothetical protein
VSKPLSSRDPVAVARAAKRLVQSGDWRRQIAQDDKVKILMSLKARLPFAIGVLPVDGLVALTKQPPPGGCHWCACFVQRAPDKTELERNETNLALLGQGCRSCQARWQVDARVAAVVAEEQERERLATELCHGRPWLTAALAASAHGPGSLHAQMDQDVWRLGAHRAAAKWGIEPGIFLGDRAAIRRVARHPVWGPALTRRYDNAG